MFLRVQVSFTVERFEKDFFGNGYDAISIFSGESEDWLYSDFLYNIIGTTPDKAISELPKFLSTYKIWLSAIKT
jgi:hypothetical protein